MSANCMCLYGIENVDDVTRNVKLKIIFHIFFVLSRPSRGVYAVHVGTSFILTELQLPHLVIVKYIFESLYNKIL